MARKSCNDLFCLQVFLTIVIVRFAKLIHNYRVLYGRNKFPFSNELNMSRSKKKNTHIETLMCSRHETMRILISSHTSDFSSLSLCSCKSI